MLRFTRLLIRYRAICCLPATALLFITHVVCAITLLRSTPGLVPGLVLLSSFPMLAIYLPLSEILIMEFVVLSVLLSGASGRRAAHHIAMKFKRIPESAADIDRLAVIARAENMHAADIQLLLKLSYHH